MAVLPVALLTAPAAAASEHVRVNEIHPAGGFVELLDVLPGDDPFPEPGYEVVVYDGAGTELASRSFSPPYPFLDVPSPYVIDGLPLPAGSGLRRGRLGRVFFSTVGKDNACRANKVHSDRLSYLTP